VEGDGFHAFENTADPGALGTAGIEWMHQGTASRAEGLQRLIKITCIERGLRDAGLRRAAHEVVEKEK
jgi:hypothetical protein